VYSKATLSFSGKTLKMGYFHVFASAASSVKISFSCKAHENTLTDTLRRHYFFLAKHVKNGIFSRFCKVAPTFRENTFSCKGQENTLTDTPKATLSFSDKTRQKWHIFTCSRLLQLLLKSVFRAKHAKTRLLTL